MHLLANVVSYACFLYISIIGNCCIIQLSVSASNVTSYFPAMFSTSTSRMTLRHCLYHLLYLLKKEHYTETCIDNDNDKKTCLLFIFPLYLESRTYHTNPSRSLIGAFS